ncbi:zinc finger protein [Goodfellowiella coeruleoviolacea]|uniref:Zinc-finger n=1 Tax=Goodfellowiella coeruleoviolacea TaxID=334858 RepID=A0AAE3GKQ3_9PSEU|nr:zinc finger protein [Goodfellowiella coeruleoviolacea]MCP2169275.1 zinc-finger [Goodfellowiella coeruleoviolacea]
MKTFRWLPLDQRRHAIPGEVQGQNIPVTTLCGQETTTPDHVPTKVEWLWETCWDCHEKARGYVHIGLALLAEWRG